MDHHAPDNSRRRFIKLTAIGLAAAPCANILLSGRTAHAADLISESDPSAAALAYVADATKSDKRTDKTALCSNCGLYTGKEGEETGPCAIFPGKLVHANGWCTAWVKKAA